jgi:hypothetical protein
MAMDATLAAPANGRQAIVDIDREEGRNKLISCLIYYFTLNPLTMALADPFCRGSWVWGMFCHKNMLLERQMAPSWCRCLCDVCFSSQKPSEQEFWFLPEQT